MNEHGKQVTYDTATKKHNQKSDTVRTKVKHNIDAQLSREKKIARWLNSLVETRTEVGDITNNDVECAVKCFSRKAVRDSHKVGPMEEGDDRMTKKSDKKSKTGQHSGRSQPQTKAVVKPVSYADTGRERLIRSHSSARFCFKLSGNFN